MKSSPTKVRFRDTFWFLPTVYNFGAVALAAITIFGDYTLTSELVFSGLLLIRTELAVTLVSTLAGAILTMTTITFSSIMVVLSTYSSQFSPRVLQNFIADRPTQRVLAIFSSGFSYTLIVLLFMDKAHLKEVILSPTVAVVWGLVSIGAFIYLIHHTATFMQVNNLIGILVSECEAAIERVTSREIHDQRSELSDQDSRALRAASGHRVAAPVSGYVTLIDMARLFAQARRENAVVEMEVHIGAYIMKGLTIMTVYSDRHDGFDPDTYSDCLEFGNEQSDWQDIAFGLRKLVEIAVRAVSPSVNDPYTASTCLHRLAPLLTTLAQRDQRVSAFYDDDANLRLVARDFHFEDYLFKSFHEIRYYGKTDVTVVSALLQSLTHIARGSPNNVAEAIWRFGSDTADIFTREDVMQPARAAVLERLEVLAEATGQREAYRRSNLLSKVEDDQRSASSDNNDTR